MNYVVPLLSLAIFALWGWGAFYAGSRYGFDEGRQYEREQMRKREERMREAMRAMGIGRTKGLKVIK